MVSADTAPDKGFHPVIVAMVFIKLMVFICFMVLIGDLRF
jgi:hypothetical protein